MKILKMKLENFQGVKELEIDPQGESSAIYGDNGTGKSTVYNAFTWLMYGNLFNTEVGALDPDEAPLIIAALEELASTYKKTVPGAGNIADTFRKNTKSIVFMTKVPKGN